MAEPALAHAHARPAGPAIQRTTSPPNWLRQALARHGYAPLAIWTVMAQMSLKSGRCWPGFAYLYREAGTSRRTAIRAVHLLIEVGAVRRTEERVLGVGGFRTVYELAYGVPFGHGTRCTDDTTSSDGTSAIRARRVVPSATRDTSAIRGPHERASTERASQKEREGSRSRATALAPAALIAAQAELPLVAAVRPNYIQAWRDAVAALKSIDPTGYGRAIYATPRMLTKDGILVVEGRDLELLRPGARLWSGEPAHGDLLEAELSRLLGRPITLEVKSR